MSQCLTPDRERYQCKDMVEFPMLSHAGTPFSFSVLLGIGGREGLTQVLMWFTSS